MSNLTSNFQFVKPELTDIPDITQTNENWDKLDSLLNKDVFTASLSQDGETIIVNTNFTIHDGSMITFKAPCDSESFETLQVNYPSGNSVSSSEYTIKNTSSELINEIEGAFKQNTYVTVVLDTSNHIAYIHNEATTTVQDGSLTEAKFADDLALKTVKDYVTPEMFGAVGDGIVDDTTAIQNVVTECATYDKMLYLPMGKKYNIPNLITISGVKTILCYGKLIVPNGIEIIYSSSRSGECNWYIKEVDGELVLAGLKCAIIDVICASKLVILADSTRQNLGSVAYTTFNLGNVPILSLKGIGSGWVNENYFYGGRISTLIVGDGGGRYSHNNNHFYNPCIEGSSSSITFYYGNSNYIHGARFEGSPTITFAQTASNNYIEKAWVEQSIPKFVNSYPNNWNDNSGNNYYFLSSLASPVRLYQLDYTIHSKNYNVTKLYPSNGKLHNSSYNSDFFESDYIPISRPIGLNITSDKKFFRGRIYIYDENKDPITTEPSQTIFYGTTPSGFNNGEYIFYNINLNIISCSVSKKSVVSGNDSGVYYIKIKIEGYGSADFDRFTVKITAPYDADIKPFIDSPMTAESMPTSGDWENGDIVYNINSSVQCLGWFYHNGGWHVLGEYT